VSDGTEGITDRYAGLGEAFGAVFVLENDWWLAVSDWHELGPDEQDCYDAPVYKVYSASDTFYIRQDDVKEIVSQFDIRDYRRFT